MKILFIYPGIANIGFNAIHSGSENPDTWYIPLGICYLAAVLKKGGHEVDLIDFRYEKGLREIQKKMDASNADVVAISFQTPSASYAYQTAKFAKQMGKIVIGGGIHPTVMPKEAFATGYFDHIVVGEGIISLAKLIKDIEAGISREAIITGEIETNLDSLPIPHPFKIYETHVIKKRKLVLMFTSRGCPGRCTFCQPVADKMFGKKIHTRKPENILSEVIFWKKKYKIKHFMIVDDIFTLKKKYVLEFCQKLVEADLSLTWSINSRVDTFDEEMAQALSESKCIWSCIGFESGSQRILDYLNKKTTVERGIKTAALCRKYNLNFSANLLVGVPTETEEDYKLNFKFISEIKPTIVSYNYLVPYPGTEIYNECIKQRWLNGNINHERYEMNANRKKGLISCVNYDMAKAWEYPINNWKEMKGDIVLAETLASGAMADKKDHLSLALKRYRHLTKLDPESIIGNYSMGSIFNRQNKMEDAARSFKKVIFLAQNTQNKYFVGASYYQKGIIHKKLGLRDKAKSDFQNCLKIIPDHNKAKEELNLFCENLC